MLICMFFFISHPPTSVIYTLSLHDALPIFQGRAYCCLQITSSSSNWTAFSATVPPLVRSEEHTSELQSHSDLVCRLLLEKKKPHQALGRDSVFSYAGR